jgi:hypothetical protein
MVKREAMPMSKAFLIELLGERGDWTPLQPLASWHLAPGATGLYEIGLLSNGYRTPYLDVGYPSGFRPMYVGITMRTLSVRLREHADGGPKANGSVRSFQQHFKKSGAPAANGLHYTCFTHVLPAVLECMRIQRKGGTQYPWNTRSEIQTAMSWSNTTAQELEAADLKSLLGKLQQSRALQELIRLSESGS